MQEILTSIEFFLPQIIIGTVLGIVLSFLGVILVLRNMAFFGVTLSQVVTSSVALSLFFGFQEDYVPILFSTIFMVSLLLIKQDESRPADTMLGIVFVTFSAFSQFLLSLGGNVKNHLMSAYFGDILTSQVKLNSPGFIMVIISLVLFFIYYKKILFLSFDRDEFSVRKLGTTQVDFIYYLITTISLSVSVNLLGSFYSIAHLLIPVYVGLIFARSMGFLFIFSGIFSILSTITGFVLSLKGVTIREETIYFPTSSTIVVFMAIIAFAILLSYRLIRTIRKRA